MKNKQVKTKVMSWSAFESHIVNQLRKLEALVEDEGGFEPNAKMYDFLLKNPLAVISTLGLTNSMDEEEAAMFMTAASFSFGEQFGKFSNLTVERYAVVLTFLHHNFDQLKIHTPTARSFRNDCYAWICDPDLVKITELKEELDNSLERLNIKCELDDLNSCVPLQAQSPKSKTFKI